MYIFSLSYPDFEQGAYCLLISRVMSVVLNSQPPSLQPQHSKCQNSPPKSTYLNLLTGLWIIHIWKQPEEYLEGCPRAVWLRVRAWDVGYVCLRKCENRVDCSSLEYPSSYPVGDIVKSALNLLINGSQLLLCTSTSNSEPLHIVSVPDSTFVICSITLLIQSLPLNPTCMLISSLVPLVVPLL